KVVMAALALAGIAGMYLRQVRQIGVLGLLGYVLFTIGYLLILAVAFIAGYVLPGLTHTDPAYVQGLLDVPAGEPTQTDLGTMMPVIHLEGLSCLAGGLVFGIAMFRARVLARWAVLLLAFGSLSTAALPLRPHVFMRFFAIPTGVALIGLGISLWRREVQR